MKHAGGTSPIVVVTVTTMANNYERHRKTTRETPMEERKIMEVEA
jgi:hypothetical protein